MKVHWYNGLAGEYSSGYEPCDFTEYEIEDIKKAGYSEVWYWYGVGYYEGAGYAIMKKPKDKRIYVKYIGHCSCYGPTDNIHKADEWPSLSALKKGATEDLLEELKPLIDMMENKK